MLSKAAAFAEKQKGVIVETAQKIASEQIDREIERLEDLRLINSHVRPAEIEALKSLKLALLESLSAATLRADALKLVLRVADGSPS